MLSFKRGESEENRNEEVRWVDSTGNHAIAVTVRQVFSGYPDREFAGFLQCFQLGHPSEHESASNLIEQSGGAAHWHYHLERVHKVAHLNPHYAELQSAVALWWLALSMIPAEFHDCEAELIDYSSDRKRYLR